MKIAIQILCAIVIAASIYFIAQYNPDPCTSMSTGSNQSYMSYCNSDKLCEQRELTFIREHGYTPITDSELMDVYDIKRDELLMNNETIKPILKPLPPDVYCEDCQELIQ